jgi:hypothetical protein
MSTKTNDLNPDRTNLIEAAELTRSNLIDRSTVQFRRTDTTDDVLIAAADTIRDLITALTTAESDLADADALYDGYAKQTIRKITEQAMKIAAVMKWRHDWFNEPVDGVPRKRHVQRLDEILDRKNEAAEDLTRDPEPTGIVCGFTNHDAEVHDAAPVADRRRKVVRER